MALKINKPSEFGVDATYWRVMETNINWAEQKAHVTIAGYLTKKARTNGSQPLISYSMDWQGEEFPYALDLNILKTTYEKLTTLQEWSASIADV